MRKKISIFVIVFLLGIVSYVYAQQFYAAKLGAGQAVTLYPRNVVAVTASMTIPVDYIIGGTIIEAGGDNITLTMPRRVMKGDQFCVVTTSANKIMITPNASDIIHTADGTALTAGYSLKNNTTAGDTVCVYGSSTAGHIKIISEMPLSTTWTSNSS